MLPAQTSCSRDRTERGMNRSDRRMPRGYSNDTGVNHRFKDRVGVRTGRLTFTRCVGENAHRHKIWEAVCDCGNVITTSSPSKTKSCGCLRSEKASARQLERALPPDEKRRRILANRVMQRERRKTNPILAMQARLSRLHRHAIASVGAIKSSPTFEALGYTAAEFAAHIERQFLPGMGWSNMRMWQIDHIIPVSSAKTEADVVSLNQLSNLRPLWSAENNRKKDIRQNLL